MKPVTQQVMHDVANGQFGDCQRAVIASLLELPIEDVPHFLQDAKGDPTAYWQAIQKFCRGHGYAYLTAHSPKGLAFYGDDGDVFHEISGPSPRHAGTFHAVIGKNGQVFFDPHPSRAGLAGDPATWEHAYLVPTRPTTNRKPYMYSMHYLGEPVDAHFYDKDKADAEMERRAHAHPGTSQDRTLVPLFKEA